jgi:hypothetical protein
MNVCVIANSIQIYGVKIGVIVKRCYQNLSQTHQNVRNFQIKKYPIALEAMGAFAFGTRETVACRNWIIYFLEFPKPKPV